MLQHGTVHIQTAYFAVQDRTHPCSLYFGTAQCISIQLTLRYRRVHIHCTVYSTVNLIQDCSKKTIVVTSIIIIFSLNTVVYNCLNMNHVVNLRRCQPHGIWPPAV
jgi:hypothetical protein